jgi:AAA domain
MPVIVTGASGAGTTTLAQALAHHWAVPHVDVDDYYWLKTDPPFTEKRSSAERLSRLLEYLRQHPSSVLSGSVMGWSMELENGFDAVVFLYVETWVRLRRLEQRETERYGRVNGEFLEWAAHYDEGDREGRSLARHEAWLAERTCPVLRISGDHPLSETIRRVISEVPNPAVNRTRRQGASSGRRWRRADYLGR